ncbi:uncharacterized protein LTR77_005554 [Saxophila tyrrhenica]|uniref:Pentatricopeptide repeat protein n=1 Tax=Saxophila tyrrhenica TaxID=1690608 RepID=A0AAV9PCV3_9PEZI|nr:hypothetical protein LTR77_005554 [Saxophila tyrrhenica]
MLECRACVWRCIRAIAGDSRQAQALYRRPLLLTPQIEQNPFRRHASTAVATTPPAEDLLVPGRQPVVDKPESQTDGDKQQKTVPVANERHLKTELRYLQDKVKLAEHVHYTLRCDKPEKALDLCRLASKQQEVIVSWNHCVDWYIQRGKVDEAIKIYNEMKKRAQFPDGHTYSLLLRGLAKPPYSGEPVKDSHVAKALSIYYSMSSPTSRAEPNIIHTNGVLKVCSAALDMDALWGVVSKLPEHGARSPDHITYAILLDGIRHGAFGKDPTNVPAESLAANRTKAVQEGRAIWRDVIKKWRGAEIHIDERLVCAMAQLLFISSRIQDWDDVLNLVQQTMKIPRQLAPLDSPQRHIEHVPQENDLRQAEPEQEEDSDGYTDTPTTKAFLPVQSTSLSFVQPGNAILNILVNGCTLLRSPKAASAYWGLLTEPSGPYAIKPDLSNFHTYLRLLGKNRSSARAVALLQQISSFNIQPTAITFRLVMGICDRDKNNPNMLENARTIIDLMESTLADLDVRTLIKYLNLVLLSDDGPKIIFAVNRLDSIIHNLRSRVTYGAHKTGTATEQHMLDKEETLFFFRTLVGVIDTLNRRELVPREAHSHWQGRRAQLDAFIQRSNTKLEQQRAKLEVTTGKKAPRMRELDPKKGMSMKAEEYALRKFRWGERQKREEKEEMVKARGVLDWNVRKARPDVPTKGAVLKKWRANKEWAGRQEPERSFADSPMELGER